GVAEIGLEDDLLPVGREARLDVDLRSGVTGDAREVLAVRIARVDLVRPGVAIGRERDAVGRSVPRRAGEVHFARALVQHRLRGAAGGKDGVHAGGRAVVAVVPDGEEDRGAVRGEGRVLRAVLRARRRVDEDRLRGGVRISRGRALVVRGRGSAA